MYQEIMGDSINVPTAVILGMNDQTWPHKEEPKGLWTGTDLKMSQRSHDDVKYHMKFNSPYKTHNGIVQKQKIEKDVVSNKRDNRAT